MAAIPNITKLITTNGYKTSGSGHPRVRFNGESQGWVLMHHGRAMTLQSEKLEELKTMLREERVAALQGMLREGGGVKRGA
eukprot:2305358-Alexandrium_andersonii.AAC.1